MNGATPWRASAQGARSTLAAVIFDLDGLILDSETPEVLAWQGTYARYGLDFPVSCWLQNIGRNDRPWDPYVPFRAAHSLALPGKWPRSGRSSATC